MPKLLLIIAILTLSHNAFSERIESSIHSVDLGGDTGPDIIKLTNGRVAYIDNKELAVITAKMKEYKNKVLEIELGADNSLVSLKVIGPAPQMSTLQNRSSREEESFSPSVLQNYEQVEAMFKRQNDRFQRISECYNRAHVWAYEEFKKTGTKSQKSFIFFTNSYLRKYRFNWWFHVAPLVKTQDGKSYVLDYRFTFAPYTPKQWSDLFVYSKRECPVVAKYSEYNQNQETEDCYFLNSSMYYWQPQDLEGFENNGQAKQEFLKFDIDWAYDEAF
jgi:hypothetical protein